MPIVTPYYPRMRAILTVPVFGPSARADVAAAGSNAVQIDTRVQAATLTLNSHLQADELKITAPWKDIGIDPRLIKNATIEFWMGNVRDENDLSAIYRRFTGICRSVNRSQKGEEGTFVEMTFQDWTSLFLDMKPFPSDGIPDYTDTLTSAWAKICAHTGYYDLSTRDIISSVEQLAPRLVFRGLEDQQLGQSVPKRIQKLGKLQLTSGQSAWDCWQVCCGALGLISYIDRDDVIVTTSTEHYSQTSKVPRFVYGSNIYDASETTNSTFSAKGVGLTSFNPLTGIVLESFYPPMVDQQVKARRAKALTAKGTPGDIGCSDYDVQEYNGAMISSQAMLDRLAKKVYDERARQELQGRFSTVEMEVDEFDLLDLHAGDPIDVRIDNDLRDALASIGDASQQYDYLVRECGYSDGVANLLVQSYAGYARLKSIFHIKQATVNLSSDKFAIDVEYQNLISISGDADAENSTENPDAAKAPTAPAALHAPNADRRGSVTVATGIVSLHDEPVAPSDARVAPGAAPVPVAPVAGALARR